MKLTEIIKILNDYYEKCGENEVFEIQLDHENDHVLLTTASQIGTDLSYRLFVSKE